MTSPPLLNEYHATIAGSLVACLAGLKWWPSRRAIMLRIGHWAFAWVAGDAARVAAKAEYYGRIPVQVARDETQ